MTAETTSAEAGLQDRHYGWISQSILIMIRFLPFTPGTHLGMRRWNSAGFWYWSYIEHEEQPVSEKTHDVVIQYNLIIFLDVRD